MSLTWTPSGWGAPAKTTLTASSELDTNDSVYVSFDKDLDESAVDFVEVQTAAGVTQTTTNSFEDSKTIKLSYNSLADGDYKLVVLGGLLSITQTRINASDTAISQAFKIVGITPPWAIS